MKKYNGNRYNSLWDASTWILIVFTAAACLWPLLLEDDRDWRIFFIVFTGVVIAFFIVLFKGIYYRIDGNNLVIYQYFVPTAFPIDKIESVLPTKSILIAPAASITNRLAIKFTDREVMKSAMPLIISPVRQREFISQLVSINPDIIHSA